MRGYSLLELLLVVGIAAIVSGLAVPLALGDGPRSRAAASAKYLAGRMATARFEAVRRSAQVAIRFRPHAGTFLLRTYLDGNGNGVSSADIAAGLDIPVGPEEAIDSHFPGTTFGILPLVTGIDPGPFDPHDPVQIGPSTLLTFSPSGTSASGTVYLRSGRDFQFAVRLLGSTGRARVLRFDFGRGTWIQQ